VRHLLRSWFAVPFAALFLALLAALFATSALAAQPIPHDIQTAIDAGHDAQADREIAQVLAAHPDSAEAHYMDARLLADEGKWPLAQAELSRAETLAPAMGFVPPDVLAAFSRQVQDHTQGGAARSMSPGFIVGAMAFVLIFVYLVAGMFRARSRPMALPTEGVPPGTPPLGTMGSPLAGPTAPPAAGSDLLDALGTGLVAGAGFAAAEALVDKLLDPGQNVAGSTPKVDVPPVDPIPNDQDFGLTGANDGSDDSVDAGSDDS